MLYLKLANAKKIKLYFLTEPIRITDSKTGDEYFAWDYSDAETEFRDIMDKEVRDSLWSYYDVDDDGNGLWPGYELEI